MNVRSIYKRIFILVILFIISINVTYSGLYIYHAPVNHTSVKVDPPDLGLNSLKARPVKHVYSLPNRLVIPKLNVDAPVVPMGLTSDGAMESPKTNNDTGWYSLGVRPGNIGSAVIAGHLGLREDAVFGSLHLLVVGDTFSVTDDQGATMSFIVRAIQTYERESDSTEIFNSKEGAHLNLITCNGDWDSSQVTYSKRLVVHSDKV